MSVRQAFEAILGRQLSAAPESPRVSKIITTHNACDCQRSNDKPARQMAVHSSLLEVSIFIVVDDNVVGSLAHWASDLSRLISTWMALLNPGPGFYALPHMQRFRPGNIMLPKMKIQDYAS